MVETALGIDASVRVRPVCRHSFLPAHYQQKAALKARPQGGFYLDKEPVSGGEIVRLAFLEHLGEVQEADHAVLRGDDTLAEGAIEGSGDFRNRLYLAGGDREDVRDAVDQHADDHVVDFGHDDGAALVGDRALHAELEGEVYDRDHRAAQVHYADDIGWRVRDRCRRGPAADFADRRGFYAEFLIVKSEGNDLERIAAEIRGIDCSHKYCPNRQKPGQKQPRHHWRGSTCLQTVRARPVDEYRYGYSGP